ncbi:MAG: hypothetical protein AAGJ83_16305, partial [Planctomycetota bacterium]
CKTMDLQSVDFSVEEWSSELRAGRTLICKCVAVAKASGILEGKIGQLTLNRDAARLWLTGELPTVQTLEAIAAAKGSQESKRRRNRGSPAPGQSGSRTDSSGSRTEKSGSRIRTSLSKDSYNSVPDRNAGAREAPPPPRPSPDRDRFTEPRRENHANPGRAETGPCIWKELPEYMFDQPEIGDALEQPVDPLPAGDLIRGVFTQLCESDLESTKAMTLWFRRQMSAPEPAIGGATEAHLLIVIACGIYASKLPDHAIRSSRVGLFVSTIVRRELRRCLKYLPEARRSLDRLMRQVPDGHATRLPLEDHCHA